MFCFRILERQLQKPYVKMDIRNVFSSIRLIDMWNFVPESVLHCTSVDTFKKKIDCYLKIGAPL